MPTTESKPSRIVATQRDEAGALIPPNPPVSGFWRRDADGGLTPKDADTAARADLAWPPEGAAAAPVYVNEPDHQE